MWKNKVVCYFWKPAWKALSLLLTYSVYCCKKPGEEGTGTTTGQNTRPPQRGVVYLLFIKLYSYIVVFPDYPVT
ncbi:hypothetical protein DN748_03920 [Sinomicrobium soli]|nr:hypothetical protein DN748_03920 [Sinomicrobium sp. N-1-3-6]